MKELVLLLALVFAVVVVLILRATISRIKQARMPWTTIKDIHEGRIWVYLRKGFRMEPYGSVNMADPECETKLYELEAEAREHAMALNMKN